MPPASSRPSSVPARAASTRRLRSRTISASESEPASREDGGDDAAGRGDREREVHRVAPRDDPSARRSAFSSGTSASARGERDDEEVGDGDAEVGRRRCPCARRSRRRRARRRCGRAGSAASSRRCSRRPRRGAGPSGGCRRSRGGGEVARDDAPAGSRSLHARELDALLAREAAGRRGGDRASRVGASRWRERAARAPPTRRRGRDRRRRRGHGASSGLDLGEDAVHGDDLALRGDDPEQPCLRRLDLHGRLVGLDLDDDLPGGDGVAVVDEPPAHLRLLHRDGELRDEQRGHATRRRTAATISSALG